MIFEICAITDKGSVQKNNEDGFYLNNIACSKINNCFVHVKMEPPIIMFVADGVGGCQYGEEAVSICMDTMKQINLPEDDNDIIGMIDKINDNVCKQKKLKDTASTIAGILFGEDTIFAFNVGDSKVFKSDNGYLNQISIDDTISGLSGDITVYKEPLIQYIGKQEIMPHIEECSCSPLYLICTDGLTDMVTLDKIEEFIKNYLDIVELGKNLVNEAKNNGGDDNISLIIIKPLMGE